MFNMYNTGVEIQRLYIAYTKHKQGGGVLALACRRSCDIQEYSVAITCGRPTSMLSYPM